jgi:hypothetical protein
MCDFAFECQGKTAAFESAIEQNKRNLDAYYMNALCSLNEGIMNVDCIPSE